MTKIEAARQEYADWCSAVGIENIEKLDAVIRSGRGMQLVKLCEERQQEKYRQIAWQILWRSESTRIVMISGPSSSGKTSSAIRIAMHCRELGLNPRVIELDNYFVDREFTPLDEDGNLDFEALGAMDIDYLGKQLNTLLDGGEVDLPKFDFTCGRRLEEPLARMKLEKGDILFMEGIHALNPALTPSIDDESIFHIYISALSALPGGEKVHNSTTDKRLLRRIVRDARSRGTSPEETILRWPSVRRGETRNIFPYEENADVVFNSSTLYDLPVLKHYAYPLLDRISADSPAREKADSMLFFLNKITEFSEEDVNAIPETSIMREFIGGQKLKL